MLKAILLGGWLALVASLAALASGVRFDSDAWLAPDHPLERRLDHVAEEFESGETLLLIIPLEEAFFASDALFAPLQALEARLKALPEVINARSPLSAKTVARTGNTLQIRSFASLLETGALPSLAALQAAFAQSPYQGRLLSMDGKTLAIRLRTATRNRAAAREALVQAVEAEVQRSPFAGTLLAGDSALKAAINRSVRQELPGLLGLGGLVILAFLYGFLRQGAQVAALMACLGGAVALALACITRLGHSLTPVSLALPLLVAVIVIADGMHIFAVWEREGGAAGSASRLRATMRKTWLPCLMTSLTSAIGFGAFAVSDLVPVRDFGIGSFVAIALCYPFLIGTLWGALAFFPARLAAAPRGQAAGIRRLALRGLSWRRRAAPVFGLVAAVMALAFLQAQTETNFLQVLFKKTSEISRAFDVADRELGGSGSVEVLLESEAPGFFQSIAAFGRVQRLAAELEAQELIYHADSYLLPVGVTHRALAGGASPALPQTTEELAPADSAGTALPQTSEELAQADSAGTALPQTSEELAQTNSAGAALPQTSEELAQELFFLELSRGEREQDLLSPYLNFTAASARLEAQTPNLLSSQLESLLDAVAASAGHAFPDLEVQMTGTGHYVHRLNAYVIATQVQSFLLTLGVLAAVFIALFGVRLGLAGFVSNLFPVLVATGMLCLLHVPFDFATVLVAGVTLGLSVDDSIHFLHHFKRERQAAGTEGGMALSLSLVARPIVLTSLLFCAGIAVFLSSSLVVLVKFALFTIAGLLAAMTSALLLLPWLVGYTLRHDQASRRQPRGNE